MAKDESSAVLWSVTSAVESMGNVKSRHQTADPGWQQTMSAFSKRKKLGGSSSIHGGNSSRGSSHSLSEHSHFSLPRKGDAEGLHAFPFASGQPQPPQENLAAIPKGHSSSSARYSSSSSSASAMSTMDRGGGAGSESQASFQDGSVYSCPCAGGEQIPSSQHRKLEEVLYCQQLNLDTHPAVTRLQNEQNLRLEGMERRMNKIRKNAQQEAERRKFAHLFRARTEEKGKTDKLLKEASVALQVFKKERQLKTTTSKQEKVHSLLSCDEKPGSRSRSVSTDADEKHENDKGDIIPVHIVSRDTSVCQDVKQPGSKAEPPMMWLLQPVERLELNGVVLWLVLPFLLPLLLLLHLLRHLSPSSENHSSKKN